MKKILCAVMVILLAGVVVFTSCSKKEPAATKLICGVTEFEPMNFRDTSGRWTGFDTELAILVGQKLGIEVEFQEIEWSYKYQELEAGTITAIWNGFTANATENGTPRSNWVDFSYSYLRNQQCVIIRSARSGEFTKVSDLAGKTAAAESGSAGESFAKEVIGSNGSIIGSPAQISTFLEVKAGSVDFSVVDVLLGKRLAGSGDYSDLMIADITLDHEVYAVGFKKGSSLRDKVNSALKELYDEGKLLDLAKKYHLEDSLVLDVDFKG
ncbi:MAG: transporter substrate-binding domain-containing protein [Treponema sp.]|jgi:polar amino acid transport system substrate-binding protein|nr:transporter substrate-binding domain-containing protein [Treponema sp.]